MRMTFYNRSLVDTALAACTYHVTTINVALRSRMSDRRSRTTDYALASTEYFSEYGLRANAKDNRTSTTSPDRLVAARAGAWLTRHVTRHTLTLSSGSMSSLPSLAASSIQVPRHLVLPSSKAIV